MGAIDHTHAARRGTDLLRAAGVVADAVQHGAARVVARVRHLLHQVRRGVAQDAVHHVGARPIVRCVPAMQGVRRRHLDERGARTQVHTCVPSTSLSPREPLSCDTVFEMCDAPRFS